ncbi:RNA polymerase sigma factor [Pedobacter nyackensis]|uniref:RNA polymerase sigma-70 factor, ECF subfamily n=1 Tax=Pedobacter nyackensis TaxID=475255 RepID=A0A1W2DUX7_9SPHI|nr:RNA polymerase sigma-70 factor [Pedobacter nyackensis]SMD01243.1 RNA polymerase sigma-70 factor, ECF subfamily [Pedobacter nyackensis]
MTVPLSVNETELLAKIAQGDQHAFRIIYNKYGKKVYTHALQLLHSTVEAEEMLQEVFLKLWIMGDGILEISSLEAYLRTLTKNRSLNVLRRMALEGKVAKALAGHYKEENNDTEEEVLMQDVRDVLNKAVQLLPLQQKQVYKLCQQDGLKYEEAAERLQLSPLTVQTHMKRALKSVRTYVKANSDITVILIILKLF